MGYDRTTLCGGFDSADSWGHFVHCGGQPAQQNIVPRPTARRPIMTGQAPR